MTEWSACFLLARLSSRAVLLSCLTSLICLPRPPTRMPAMERKCWLLTECLHRHVFDNISCSLLLSMLYSRSCVAKSITACMSPMSNILPTGRGLLMSSGILHASCSCVLFQPPSHKPCHLPVHLQPYQLQSANSIVNKSICRGVCCQCIP